MSSNITTASNCPQVSSIDQAVREHPLWERRVAQHIQRDKATSDQLLYISTEYINPKTMEPIVKIRFVDNYKWNDEMKQHILTLPYTALYELCENLNEFVEAHEEYVGNITKENTDES